MEITVRRKLKEWKEVVWCEWGRGGTEGIPDARITCDTIEVELELKFWEWRRGVLLCKIRPVQRQYHIRAARAGRRTAFLVGIPPHERDDVAVRQGRKPLGGSGAVLASDGAGAADRPLRDAREAFCENIRTDEKGQTVFAMFSGAVTPLTDKPRGGPPRMRVVRSGGDIDAWARERFGGWHVAV